mmetsp:Transcript_8391/g.8562  ORF Transcript_8391/g.8562 Transcript_8391/m.8562 type:complete len:430 (-) Transcript_8391:3519-4808(-)
MLQESDEKTGLIAALQDEMKSILDTGTYEKDAIVDISTIPRHIIGNSKLIFSRKYDTAGNFLKYKCRVVFRGDRWIDHFNNKTYSGTVKSESVKLLLALAAAKGLTISTTNVKTAFLTSTTPEGQKIYMRRPAGLTDEHMPEVILLKKCLYGLPMAPARFREHCDNTLGTIGFIPLVSDPNVYRKVCNTGQYAYIAVHVDDFLILSPTVRERDRIHSDISKHFTININNNPDSYLGLYIDNSHDQYLEISQPGYVADIIEQFNLRTVDNYTTPLPVDCVRPPVSENNDNLDKKKHQLYQSKVGTLLYLAHQTRPDILFACNHLSRYTKQPTEFDMTCVDRVLDYVAGTPNAGIRFHKHIPVILYATVDASYGMHEDRKSHTGCTVHIGNQSGPFIARSKKQSVTADSSTVAEFIAAHTAAKKSCGPEMY